MRVGVFNTAFIGDVVLSSLLIEGLKQSGHDVFLFTRSPSDLIFKTDKRISKVHLIEKGKGFKKISSIVNNAKLIESENLDVLLVPHRSATSALIAYFSKVKKRISYNVSALKFLYTQTVPYLKDTHECLRSLEVAPEMIIDLKTKDKLLKIAKPILFPTENLDSFKKLFPDFLNITDSPFFIVSPGSVWETKKYPAESFAIACLELLKLNKKLRCVVCGGNNDSDSVNELMLYVQKNSYFGNRFYNTCGKIPIYELVNLSAKASFVIANDSAPTHIASAVDTPTITIFGPTSWHFGFAPTASRSAILYYKDENGQTLPCHPCSIHGLRKCPKQHFKCMRDLQPGSLVQSVTQLIPELFT